MSCRAIRHSSRGLQVPKVDRGQQSQISPFAKPFHVTNYLRMAECNGTRHRYDSVTERISPYALSTRGFQSIERFA